MTAKTAPHVLSEGVEDHTRAFLAVQTGCDHRCTFCVIPFGRGPSRSVPMEEIASAARRLADKGFREIVLTGVDLTSYGADLCGDPSTRRTRQIHLARGAKPRTAAALLDRLHRSGRRSHRRFRP